MFLELITQIMTRVSDFIIFLQFKLDVLLDYLELKLGMILMSQFYSLLAHFGSMLTILVLRMNNQLSMYFLQFKGIYLIVQNYFLSSAYQRKLNLDKIKPLALVSFISLFNCLSEYLLYSLYNRVEFGSLILFQNISPMLLKSIQYRSINSTLTTILSIFTVIFFGSNTWNYIGLLLSQLFQLSSKILNYNVTDQMKESVNFFKGIYLWLLGTYSQSMQQNQQLTFASIAFLLLFSGVIQESLKSIEERSQKNHFDNKMDSIFPVLQVKLQQINTIYKLVAAVSCQKYIFNEKIEYFQIAGTAIGFITYAIIYIQQKKREIQNQVSEEEQISNNL